MMTKRNLGGHSGCQILLCETTENSFFVRKISGTREYNSRLQKQAEKQKAYTGEGIKTPQILRSGLNEDGLFFFDMEYIRGITLAEYMNTIQIGSIRTLVVQILNELLNQNKLSVNSDSVQIVFNRKINSLRENEKCRNISIVRDALEMLSRYDWTVLERSCCHGDLTLENIIVRNGQLYFIDFLDSFYDSWILDAGTILQDVLAMWSYRKLNELDINTIIRLMVFKDIFVEELGKRSEVYLMEIYYALLLKLVRIVPYADDMNTIEFLNAKIKLIMNSIRSMENK